MACQLPEPAGEDQGMLEEWGGQPCKGGGMAVQARAQCRPAAAPVEATAGLCW